MMLRGLVFVSVSLSLYVVSGNEENACDRSRLPWDLDLMRHVEEGRAGEEIHFAGEYRLAENNAETFDAELEGIAHRTTICNPCTEAALFRYTVSPSEKFAMKLHLTDENKNILATSTPHGKKVENTIFFRLEKDKKYFVYTVYTEVTTLCTGVFIEMVYKSAEGGYEVADCSGSRSEPTYHVVSDLPDARKIGDIERKPVYKYTTPTERVFASDSLSFDIDTYVPYFTGFGKEWRLIVHLRSEYLLGGDITAMVTLHDTLYVGPQPDMDCKVDGSPVACIFGVRGRLKNSYVIDTSVPAKKYVKVWLFRHKEIRDDKTLEEAINFAPCAPYLLTIELAQESIEESFVSCDAMQLPTSLNWPGFYNNMTGEMNVEDNILLSRDSDSQSTVLEPKFDGLLKATAYHKDLDLTLRVVEYDAGYTNSKELAKADTYGVESLTVALKKGKVYRFYMSHSYEFTRYSEGWHPHCNKASLRIEASRLDDTTRLVTGALAALPEGAVVAPPTLDFSNLTKGERCVAESEQHWFTPNASAPGEVMASYDLHTTHDTVVDVHILHNYIYGEVVAKLYWLQRAGVQLSQAKFYGESGIATVKEVTHLSDEFADNPEGEAPANLVDYDHPNSKWLDRRNTPLLFDFGAPKKLTQYQFWTANDNPERDPLTWELYGMNTAPTTKQEAQKEHLIANQSDTTACSTLRGHPTSRFEIDSGLGFRYYVFVFTSLRRYNPEKDMTVSMPSLSGTCLTTLVPAGDYRLEFTSGWEDTVAAAEEGVAPVFPYSVRVVADPTTTCTLMQFPKSLRNITSKSYLIGKYKVDPVEDDTGIHMSLDFEVSEQHMVNLDIVRSDVKIVNVTVISGNAIVAVAEDYYKEGLFWVMKKVEPSNYTIIIKLGEMPEGSCDSIDLQIAITAVPAEKDGTTGDHTSDKFEINTNGAVALPFSHSEVFEFSDERQEHFHHEMHLEQDAELRIMLRFNFEFLHIYVSICGCTDTLYKECYNCGVGRGYSVYNGNELSAQSLPAGYYIVKFYETAHSENEDNRVFGMRNLFHLTMNVVALGEPEKIAFCGHQPLPRTLEGPGGVTKYNLAPYFYHTSTEFLVPESKVSKTEFMIEADVMLKLWIPFKPDITFKTTVNRLDAKLGNIINWPGVNKDGISQSGNAINILLEKHAQYTFYQIEIVFETAGDSDCITYDLELSVTPKADPPALTECKGSDDTPFPGVCTFSIKLF